MGARTRLAIPCAVRRYSLVIAKGQLKDYFEWLHCRVALKTGTSASSLVSSTEKTLQLATTTSVSSQVRLGTGLGCC